METKLIRLYGHKGREWLKSLPKLVESIAARHRLSELLLLSSLSYHYVFSGFQGEQAIILKLGPDREDLSRESAALKAFAGLGTIRLMAEESGMMILERAIGGESLKTYFPNREKEAVEIAAKLLERLHQAEIPSGTSFPLLQDQLASLDQEWLIPLIYLQKARSLREKVMQTAKSSVLLHGDLHHDNILRHGKGWLAIDPKGIIGDPIYETVSFIQNPIPDLLAHPHARELINTRIRYFAARLSFPSELILAWVFIKSVLCWIWNIQDNADVQYDQKFTTLVYGLLQK